MTKICITRFILLVILHGQEDVRLDVVVVNMLDMISFFLDMNASMSQLMALWDFFFAIGFHMCIVAVVALAILNSKEIFDIKYVA